MVELGVRLKNCYTAASALALSLAVFSGASIAAERDLKGERPSDAQMYEFLHGAAGEWVARFEAGLESMELARDGLARDPTLSDAIMGRDRISLIGVAKRHMGALRNCALTVFAGDGSPIAQLLIDASGRVTLVESGEVGLVARSCRHQFIYDIFVLHAKPWTAIMEPCEDERVRYATTQVLASVSAVRDRRGATIGAVEVVEGLTRMNDTFAAAARELPSTCRLSILNWDGALIGGAGDDNAPPALRPPIDSLPAILTVAFDAQRGLFLDGDKLAMFLLPIGRMSEEGRWKTSVLLCADPTAPLEGLVGNAKANETDVGGATQVALLAGIMCALGAGVWFVTRQRLLRATQAARDASEEAVLERNRLISGVSHDIRGPLGAIIGFSELIRTDKEYGEDGPLRANAFDAINRSCQFILRLTDHLLDLRSAAMGRFAIEARRTDVLAICAACVDMYSIEAREKGLSISFHHPLIERLELRSDPTRIRQIVQNLVGNSVRYSERGAVTLALWIPDPTREEIEISVSDTGIGISPEGLAKIWSPFYQEKRPEGAPRSGTGLGLAVVKTIVTAIGGSIEVRSELGKGSVFVVRLPAPRWVDADESAPVRPVEGDALTATGAEDENLPLLGMSIAFADDYAEAREITSHVLRSGGAVVHSFASGNDLLQAVHCGLRVDCVLLDLQMPGLTGHAAAKALRSSGFGGPLVALSALADESTRMRSASSGFAEHLSKPTDATNLQRVIARLVLKSRSAP